MSINKVGLLAFVFIILQSRTGAVLLDFASKEQTVPEIHMRLGEVLKSCFHSRLSTLVITPDLDAVVRDILDDGVVANVFVLDDNFDSLRSHRNVPRWPVFLLTANSTRTLTLMLQRLKSSAFWHADSTFFIVDMPRGGCARASRMLWSSWKMNLLSSFYICEEIGGEAVLHTFNPFTSRAPAPWRRVETRSDGRWTLYRRLFSAGEEICNGLEFDKTEFLDGYEVNAATILLPGVTLEKNKTLHIQDLLNKILYADAMSQSVLWTKINATLIIHVDPKLYQSDGKRRLIGYKFDSRTYDYSLCGFFTEVISHDTFSFTYPWSTFSVTILTQHQKFVTPAEKIANFYSFGALSLTSLVFFITWIVFVIQKKGKMAAALEILRMALSTSLLRPLQKTSIRIYLFGVLWLVLILNATFQGHMALFLTKPTRIDVETVKDLITHHHRVYIPEQYYISASEYLQNIPNSSLFVVPKVRCYNYVINDTNAACIQAIVTMFYAATKYDLHISHKPITSSFRPYPHRSDWPLAKKVNKYSSRLMTSGLLHYWQAKNENFPLEKLESREDEATAPVIRKIKLADLNFAFVILAMGLTIATLFFVVEVGGNLMKKRPLKFPKPLQLPGRRVTRKNVVHATK